MQICETAENPLGCQQIHPNHAFYMALHYVRMFSHGNSGWHWRMELLDPDCEQKQLDQRIFYCYHLHVRPHQFNKIFQSKQLFQQYVVNAWAVINQIKFVVDLIP